MFRSIHATVAVVLGLGVSAFTTSAHADTIPIYRDVIVAPGGFSFHPNVVWDTNSHQLKAQGEVKWLGMRLVVEQNAWQVVDGNTLVFDKTINGMSGLRVHVNIQLRPERDGLVWVVNYNSYNAYDAKIGGPKGKDSGKINVPNPPWNRSTGSAPPPPAEECRLGNPDRHGDYRRDLMCTLTMPANTKLTITPSFGANKQELDVVVFDATTGKRLADANNYFKAGLVTIGPFPTAQGVQIAGVHKKTGPSAKEPWYQSKATAPDAQGVVNITAPGISYHVRISGR